MLRLIVILLVFSGSVFGQDIFECCRTGNTKKLERLLKKQPELVGQTNENGFPPLIIATYRNQEKCVRILLQLGADPNQSSQEGTALIGACYKNNQNIALLLLQQGASPNVVGMSGMSPLIFAAQNRNKTLVDSLMIKGADKEHRDAMDRTAYDYAVALEFTELAQILKPDE
jgi:ankyrin repeat protein